MNQQNIINNQDDIYVNNNYHNIKKRSTEQQEDSDDSSSDNNDLMFVVDPISNVSSSSSSGSNSSPPLYMENNSNFSSNYSSMNSSMLSSNSGGGSGVVYSVNSPALSPHGHQRKGRRLFFGDEEQQKINNNNSTSSPLVGSPPQHNTSSPIGMMLLQQQQSQFNSFKVPIGRSSLGSSSESSSGQSSQGGSGNFDQYTQSHIMNNNAGSSNMLSSSLPTSPVSWGGGLHHHHHHQYHHSQLNNNNSNHMITNKNNTFPSILETKRIRPDLKAFNEQQFSTSPSPSPPPTPTPKSSNKMQLDRSRSLLSNIKPHDPVEPLDFFKTTNNSIAISPILFHTKRQRSTSMSSTPTSASSSVVNINPFTEEGKKKGRLPNNVDNVDKQQQEEEEYSLYNTYNKTFQQLNLIGEGSFGLVYKCRHRIDGCLYAVKKTKKPLRGQKDREIVLREVFGLSVIKDHSNIVRYYNAWEEDNHIFIQMEYCNGGNIYSWVTNGYRQSQTTLLRLTKQVLNGLIHIHSLGLVHLDIKPENIYMYIDNASIRNGMLLGGVEDSSLLSDHQQLYQLLNTPGNNAVQFKLGDLGLLNEAIDTKIFSEGDSRYLSRELLHDDMGALKKSDVFSLGCTLYELARCRPLPKCGDEWNSIRNGDLIETNDFTIEFWNLIRMMINPDPQKRPSCEDLYNCIDTMLIGSHDPQMEIKRLKEQLREQQHTIQQLQLHIQQIELKNMAL